MNTLKSLLVVAVLGVIGYGVYVVLNNNPAPPTPDWVKAETASSNVPPSLQMGTAVSPGEALPSIGAASNYQPQSAAAVGSDAPGFAPTNSPPAADDQGGHTAPGSPPTSYGAVSAVNAVPTSYSPAGVTGGVPPTPSPYGGVDSSSPPATGAAAIPSRDEAGPRYGDATAGNQRNPVAPVDAAPGRAESGFEATMAAAQGQLDHGQLDMALLTLSNLYDDARLSQRQEERLNAVLDQVAGTVIYSRKYPLEPPHRVGPGERKLLDVAAKYDVPPGLLAKINGISEQAELTPGQELKIIRGPFMAIINMQKRTLAVMVGDRYAGRFPISVSPELAQLEGRFVVERKTREHVRYDGQRDLELGPPTPGTNQQTPLAIVGLSDPAAIDRSRGLIGLTPKNADDLFDMLSQGSKVVIHR